MLVLNEIKQNRGQLVIGGQKCKIYAFKLQIVLSCNRVLKLLGF